jgi:hypothetical protein
MDWDQIADRWTAMTHRLRGDRIEGLRSIGGPSDARRAPKEVDADLSKGRAPDTVGNVSNLLSQ